jgi:hypothetical protein
MGRPDYSEPLEVPEEFLHDDVADLDEDATPDEVLANEDKKKAAEQKVLDDLAAAAADEADDETPLDD